MAAVGQVDVRAFSSRRLNISTSSQSFESKNLFGQTHGPPRPALRKHARVAHPIAEPHVQKRQRRRQRPHGARSHIGREGGARNGHGGRKVERRLEPFHARAAVRLFRRRRVERQVAADEIGREREEVGVAAALVGALRALDIEGRIDDRVRPEACSQAGELQMVKLLGLRLARPGKEEKSPAQTVAIEANERIGVRVETRTCRRRGPQNTERRPEAQARERSIRRESKGQIEIRAPERRGERSSRRGGKAPILREAGRSRPSNPSRPCVSAKIVRSVCAAVDSAATAPAKAAPN